MTVSVAITTREVPGKGWIARAPELRATASGDTEAEAQKNLLCLFSSYPELLRELHGKTTRHVVIREVTVPA